MSMCLVPYTCHATVSSVDETKITFFFLNSDAIIVYVILIS